MEGKITCFIPSCIYVSPAGFTARKRFRPSSISYLKTHTKEMVDILLHMCCTVLKSH